MAEVKSPVAVALLSGGLDSTLSARLLADQKVTVIGVNFAGVYCPLPSDGPSNAARAAAGLGIELVTLPIDREFIEMVKRPKHGRGKHMNPCIDCHTLMIRKAWAYGQARGAQFVSTGEVLGQRPMSQNRHALELVARESGVGDRLLRPLSAKLLNPTVVELAGPGGEPPLVDRAKLMDIEGRGRKRQLVLAAIYRIRDFPTPAGGCLLTEDVYSVRLEEAFARGDDGLDVLELLRLGRHFRLPGGSRLVVGRDKAENDELVRRAPAGALAIDATAAPGPFCLLVPDREADRPLAAAICARYSDRRGEKLVRVRVGEAELEVEPAAPAEAARWLVA